MVKIAVLGYGVVGSGVVELFYKNKLSIEKKSGKEMDIKYILDIRDFSDSPYKEKFTKSIDDILNDDEVVAVAECMGGITHAYSFVKSCLLKGKSVSTSNKELVAEKGAELLKIAKEQQCNFFFEASVGGGIPIIRPLHKCLAANEIVEIAGILNGTTNFILTKMINESMSFSDALSMAQSLGYAEKDPTADVEGHDACRKICILSSLAFGKHVYPQKVYTKGITQIELEDVKFAEVFGGSIKLIASVKKLDNGKILPMVTPMVVPYENLISRVDDVFNAIMVVGDAIDKTMFYGRGAGKLPTASAVVADIIDSVKHNVTIESQSWEDTENDDLIEDYSQKVCRFVYRVNKINENIKKHRVLEVEGISNYAFVTEKMTFKEAEKYTEKLKSEQIEVLSSIPVLDLD